VIALQTGSNCPPIERRMDQLSRSRFRLLLTAYTSPYMYFPPIPFPFAPFCRPPPPLPLLLLIWFVAQFLPAAQANHENCVTLPSRPFYLIGHMTNSLSDVKRFLSGGANALEIDVQFDSEGMIDSVFHGIPCDCFRYELESLLFSLKKAKVKLIN
jgi:hypothetical protein